MALETKDFPKTIGKMLITNKNYILTDSILNSSPSQRDGLDCDTEVDYRIMGYDLIQETGKLLQLPKFVVYTAQMLFQRYYYFKSFIRYEMEHTAMSCIHLATKIEESPRKIRHIIEGVREIRQEQRQKPESRFLNGSYLKLKKHVITTERSILKQFDYCFHINHIEKLIIKYLRMLGLETQKIILDYCSSFVRDSLKSDIFVRFSSETIANACIDLASDLLHLPLPKEQFWRDRFKKDAHNVADVYHRIITFRKRSLLNYQTLDAVVKLVRKEYEDSMF